MVTDINVGALTNWMRSAAGGAALNQYASQTLGHQLNSIYVNDERAAPGELTAVRVSNGQQLPPSGLTVATDLPLYVEGQFNAPNTTPGSTNTANTLPASLVGDAITVLSGNWKDTYGNDALSARTPANTTVNAAFLAGIVQPTNTTGTLNYSGGVENFPRFLEDWSGYTFTYNGSMVVLYPSQFATNYWVQTGAYYNAPNRKWAFDLNFLNYQRPAAGHPTSQRTGSRPVERRGGAVAQAGWEGVFPSLPENSTCPFGAFGKGYSYYEKSIHPYRTVGDCHGRGADGL